jgi:hypothetical protein
MKGDVLHTLTVMFFFMLIAVLFWGLRLKGYQVYFPDSDPELKISTAKSF